ncbi:MAG: lipopolysaccharide biosynthesis protein, partial [Bacteroidetes bacterium]|nr:lipopolysaccharide biosynthesis protein [Fibrella sp.]
LAASDELKKKQDELTEAQNQLINARVYNRGATTITQQQTKVDRISEELKATASRYYAATNSSESVPQAELVSEWSTKVTDYEESSARLKLFDSRLKETEAKAAGLTPLGTKQRQLNRELTVAEKEYLASTDNLNQARTQQGDVTKAGTLSTLDKPSYPLSPMPSKRMLLVAASIGAGLFLTLFLVAIRFWLDQRVNSPEKAELFIGRPVAALFPTVRKGAGGSRASRVALNMLEQLCNALNIEIVQKTAKPHPPIITVFSIRSQQGKTWTINGLANIYADAGQQVAYFYPRFAAKTLMTEQNGITFIPYTVRPDFMNVLKLEHLLDEDDTFVAAHYDQVILELPSLVSTAIPVYLVDKSYVSVLVVDASSPWARTEKQLLEMYMRVATHPVLTVLNRVEGDYMEAFGQLDAGYQQKRSINLLADQRNLPTG